MTRILLIQPDATIRKLLEIQLRLLGHELLASGEAPAAALPSPYDVLVIDPHAPGAADFARVSRARLVFVSTREPNDASRALDPAAHLTLPYALGELRDAIG